MKISRIRTYRSACWAICLLLTTHAFGQQLLYDVTFAQPFHTYGQPVATDLGPIPRRGPSTTNFVSPTVVASYGSFMNGAARFQAGASSLSQMSFAIEGVNGVGVDSPAYSLDFDVNIDNLQVAADEFAIFFDGPQSNRFSFRGDGLIQYGAGANFIGTFNEDNPMHVHVDFLGDANHWTIAVDGQTLYSGSLMFAYTGLQTIRLSLNDSGAIDSAVYVDNVVIRAIPSPPTLMLLPFVLAAFARRRRRI